MTPKLPQFKVSEPSFEFIARCFQGVGASAPTYNLPKRGASAPEDNLGSLFNCGDVLTRPDANGPRFILPGARALRCHSERRFARFLFFSRAARARIAAEESAVVLDFRQGRGIFCFSSLPA